MRKISKAENPANNGESLLADTEALSIATFSATTGGVCGEELVLARIVAVPLGVKTHSAFAGSVVWSQL